MSDQGFYRPGQAAPPVGFNLRFFLIFLFRGSFSFAVLLICLLSAAPSYAQDLTPLESTIRTGTTEQKRDALFQIRDLRSESASRSAIPALSDTHAELVRLAAQAPTYNFDPGLLVMEIGTLLASLGVPNAAGHG